MVKAAGASRHNLGHGFPYLGTYSNFHTYVTSRPEPQPTQGACSNLTLRLSYLLCHLHPITPSILQTHPLYRKPKLTLFYTLEGRTGRHPLLLLLLATR